MKVLRARSSIVLGWMSVGFGLILAISDIVASGVTDAQVGIGAGTSIGIIGVAAFLRPAVVISPDGVAFRNLLLTVTAPFSRIQEISMRWSLEMLGDDGKKADAFAAPASRGARTGVFNSRPADASRRVGDEGRADSIGTQVYDAWQAWSENHRVEPDRTMASMTRQLDMVGLVLVLGSVAAVVFAFSG